MVNGASRTDQEMTILAERFYSATVGTFAYTNEQEVYDVARLLDEYRSYYHLTNRELQNRFNTAVEEEILEHGGDLDSYETKEVIEFKDQRTGKMAKGEVLRYSLTQAVLGDEMSGDELEYSLGLYGYSGAPEDVISSFISAQKLYKRDAFHLAVEFMAVAGATSGAWFTVLVDKLTFSLGLAYIGLFATEAAINRQASDNKISHGINDVGTISLIGTLIVFGIICEKHPYVRAATVAFSTSMIATRLTLSEVIYQTTKVNDKHR